MSATPISKIIEMAPDMPVAEVRGVLAAIYERKSGKSSAGEWSFQNGLIGQGEDKIRVTFSGREEIPSNWKGKEIVICAAHGKHGWNGCKTKEEEYKGEKRLVLWVTASATVMLASDEPDEAELPEENDDGDLGPVKQPAQPAQPATAAPAAHPLPVHGATVGMCLKEACNIVNQLGSDPFAPSYYQQVYQIASDLIRVARLLESGKLAESAKHRKEAAS